MDDLPELPFEKVLSYLNLKDRLRSRAVSRRWYHKISCLRPTSLGISKRPIGFVFENSRLASGSFARNFISSVRFESFVNTFSQTILANLKHLRLCGLTAEGGTAFSRTLISFTQLEQLDIIRFGQSLADSDPKLEIELNLPMLTGIQLNEVRGISKLTLDSPRLLKVQLCGSPKSLRVDLVHLPSVEWLFIDQLSQIDVEDLTRLKYLYYKYSPGSTILCTTMIQFAHLKEVHLFFHASTLASQSEFEPRVQLFIVSSLLKVDIDLVFKFGHADLKIYLLGCLLNGPDDPAFDSLWNYHLDGTFDCLADNQWRLEDEIPLCDRLDYSAVERVAPELAFDLANKFTDLNELIIATPIQDTERFLDFLKSSPNIVALQFWRDHPRDLFDRLPAYCALQKLDIRCSPVDFEILFRLKHLIRLKVAWSVDAETIPRAFYELPFLSQFEFKYADCPSVKIEIADSSGFKVQTGGEPVSVPDLNAAVSFIDLCSCSILDAMYL